MSMDFKEQVYVVEIVKGLMITIRNLLRNMMNMRGMPTISYPEIMKAVAHRYRGRHRLTQKEDGMLKCTACMLCATACPAKCIQIEAKEGADGEAEKYPSLYNIDMLECVYCGLCVEACPCDAIRMDTGIHPPPADSREKFIYRIEDLTTYPEIKNPRDPV